MTPRKLPDWTNAEIKRRYNILRARTSKLVDTLCEAGLGALTHSSLRLSDHPAAKKYIAAHDEMRELLEEARMRYGPDFMFMSQLR